MNRIDHAFDRYNRRIERNGTWTVFDILTGRPAEIGSRPTTGMQLNDAVEVMDILNRVRPASGHMTIH